MKKFIKNSLFIIIAFALCFASCSKDDSASAPPDNKTLLTANTWSAVKLGTDYNKDGKIDDTEYKPLPPGQTFFYLTFSADGTLIARGSYENKISVVSYSWQLIDAQTIKLVNQASPYLTNYWHITTLTATQFNVEEYNADNTILGGAVRCVAK